MSNSSDMIPPDVEQSDIAQAVMEKVGAEPMSLVALHIQEFLSIMMRELDRSGFIGLEFIEKGEMMLRSVTASYPLSDFLVILHIFQELDASFIETEFYRGLCTLRQICTHDDLSGQSNLAPHPVNSGNAELIMFATHLVENLRQYFNQFRKLPKIREMTNTEIKFALQDAFRDSLGKTILENDGYKSGIH